MSPSHTSADDPVWRGEGRPTAALATYSTASIATSPLQEISCAQTERAGVRLLIKRDDLMHPQLGGNKWRKLKYNIEHMRDAGIDTLLTFGGAWSNHIHASAAAGKHFNLKTIGIIRGADSQIAGKTPSHTLQFAQHCGMHLHFIDRQQYRNKDDPAFMRSLLRHYETRNGPIHVIPEGGNNALAMHGCREIIDEILGEADIEPDVICCSSGTGTTLAGMVCALQQHERGRHLRATGFSALKIADTVVTSSQLHGAIGSAITGYLDDPQPVIDWNLETRYHFGGYARVNDTLAGFIEGFRHRHGILLDMVYTGKMMFGLMDMIDKGEYPRGTTIVAVHSGGLQGNRGFPQYRL